MNTEATRTAARLDPAAVRRTLKAANLRARHGLSQNFLTDEDVLDGILAAAAPSPGRRILEVGPGLGILTEALLRAGAVVTAVELDTGLVTFLRTSLAAPLSDGSLRIVEGDVLDEDLGTLVDPPFDVVANLPYHITSPVLHRLLALERPPERVVLMVQREVAERIAAPAGGMSYLSVFVQYHASVRIAFMVPRTAFEPEPNVDSAVIVLDTTAAEAARPLPSAEAEDDLWRLVQAGFRERRKMLHNVLSRQLPLDASRVEDGLAAAGIAGDRRPQTLSVDEWLRLHAALGPMPPDRRGQKSVATE